MQLPVINKISYSALNVWQYCSWHYVLANVLKLKPDDSNIYTSWGTLMHRCAQGILIGKYTPEEGADKLKRTWIRFCRLYKKQLAQSHPEIKKPLLFAVSAYRALLTIKDKFQEEFGNYKVMAVEFELERETDWPQKFRGFIDIIIETENGNRIIADFKSTNSTFYFNKYRKKYQDYQLMLYKHHYVKEYFLDPKIIETYFITIERDHTSKTPISFTKVTSGKKKVQNSVDWMNGALSAINREVFIKNRFACHKFSKHHEGEGTCIFYQTEHCT